MNQIVGASDFWRLVHVPMLWTIGIVVAIFVASNIAETLLEENDEEAEMVEKVRNILLTIVGVGFLMFVFVSGSINTTSRSVIDRSDINKEQERYEERLDRGSK